MKIISVSIENFLSIEKAHVTFDDAGLLLIEGYNYDVDRANGAGKTAILNAISFGLYDRIPRKVTASELLRRGSKKGSVTMEVATDSGRLFVKRSRPKGVLFYSKDADQIEELVLTQEEFERKLRLSYNQFIVTMYCSQANSNGSPRFLLLNDADKKQFLLQLLDLDEFSLCKKKTDEKIAQLLGESNLAFQSINVLQSKIDAFSESLIDEDEVRSELLKKSQARQGLMTMLDQHTSVQKPDLAKYQKLEDDIQMKKTTLAQMRARREMLRSSWDSLGRKIKPFNAADACPTCGTELDNTYAKSVHETEVAKLQEERLAIKTQIDKIDEMLLQETKINELAQKVKEKKRQESAEYEKANLARVDLTAKINAIDSLLVNLRKKLDDNATLAERVQALRGKQKEFQEKVAALSEEIEIQKTVANIYSPTGAQAYVLDSAVSLFNERVAKYVGILWSNLTYELQSYKENVKGEVTAKFSESIVMDGKPISLGSLSGGELRALSICTDMALLELLEQQFGIHMSPVIFDEAFDGLDSAGKEFALELIKELAQDRQVVVVDHASEMRASFDKVLRVEKRNGVSSVNTTT